MFTNPEQAVLVAPFDQRTLVMTGVPRPAFVATNQGSSFTVSKDGTLLYQARPAAPGLVLVDRTGSERQLRDDPVQAMYPRVSPDGRRIAMGAEGSDGMNIWVLDMTDSVLSRLTFGGDDIYPSWSADGHDILFSRSAAGSTAETEWTFYRIPADGGGEPRPMFQEPQSQVEILETPDGRWFVYRAGDVARGEDPDLYCTPTDGGEHRRIVVSPFNDRSPALSPDGRWLAYVSDESGVDDVYVQRFPGPAGRRQVSDGGGTSPVWSRSGAELFYITGGYLVAAEVETTTEFAVRNRQRLFPTSPYVQSGSHAAYDVLAGDSAFVFVDRGYHRTRLDIVLNWFEELPR
jgi:Tol biopolymer transport system component